MAILVASETNFAMFDFEGWDFNNFNSLGIAAKSFAGYKFEFDTAGR